MQTIVKLFAHPPATSGTARPHWYHYSVEFDGVEIVTDSIDPEHDLARVLLSRGVKGTALVVDGRTGQRRSFVQIEKAAKLQCLDGKRGLSVNRYDAKWATRLRGGRPEAPSPVEAPEAA